MIKIEEEVLREFLCLLVSVTLELQDRLRTMFLPTAERCHYIFNMKDIGTVFRFANLKLTIYVELFSKAISWGRKWQLCVVLICHDYYEITRPDGINFVFPVSRPTLWKRADPKIFILKFFSLILPEIDTFWKKCINLKDCLFKGKKNWGRSKQETRNLFHPALWTNYPPVT